MTDSGKSTVAAAAESIDADSGAEMEVAFGESRTAEEKVVLTDLAESVSMAIFIMWFPWYICDYRLLLLTFQGYVSSDARNSVGVGSWEHSTTYRLRKVEVDFQLQRKVSEVSDLEGPYFERP